MAQSTARAHWEGTLLEGSGQVSTSSPALDAVAATWKDRTNGGPGTTPEELFGAAHAACFNMALSGALAKAGHEARSLDTTAAMEFGPVEGGFGVIGVAITVDGDVPSLDDDAFEEFANGAKTGCPISQLINGIVEVTLTARLVTAV